MQLLIKMVIYFNSENARKELLSSGVVITARKTRRGTGNTIAVYTTPDRFRHDIGWVNVQLLDECDRTNIREILGKYVKNSGFDSVGEWINEIRKLNSNRWMPEYMFLFKVEMIEK